MHARPDRPLRARSRGQDSKGALVGEDFSLPSLLNMSHRNTRSARGGGVLRIETEGVL
jgi:hypothetical protein